MSSLNLPRWRFEWLPRILSLDPREKVFSIFFSTPLPQEGTESHEITPQPALLQTRRAQSPPPLSTGDSFQRIHQLCCPPLDAFQRFQIYHPPSHPQTRSQPREHTVLIRENHCAPSVPPGRGANGPVSLIFHGPYAIKSAQKRSP